MQTWYAGQHLHGCDKTACASCRWWYKCNGSTLAWWVFSFVCTWAHRTDLFSQPCDATHYCASREPHNKVLVMCLSTPYAYLAALDQGGPCLATSLRAATSTNLATNTLPSTLQPTIAPSSCRPLPSSRIDTRVLQTHAVQLA